MSINRMLASIESEIAKQRFGNEPKSLYEPLRYIMALGGKRLRPLLAVLSYSLYRKDFRRIVPIAIALEVFHNFTLLHDDIMDKAPLRRGKQTVHEKWNVSTAILSGDVMQIKVYGLLLSVGKDKLIKVLTAFNRCATEVCEGQQWDMEFEHLGAVTEARYLDMIRLKTASLLGFSLELGGILANASHREQKALHAFGINIGMGFQLKDDLLDVYGDKKKFGKQVGGDIIANKKTFMLIRALNAARGEDRKELLAWLKKKSFNKKKKIAAVTKIFDSLGIRGMAEKKVEFYFRRAYDQLNLISGRNKGALISFTERIHHRQT